MKDIIDQIWSYRRLSVDGRQRVDAYIKQHPELKTLFDEVEALYENIEEVNVFRNGGDTEAALSYYIAARYFDEHRPPDEILSAYNRMKARLDRDSDLRRQHHALSSSMEEVVAASNPHFEFERLTGQNMDVPQEPARGFAPDREPRLRVSKKSAGQNSRASWKLALVVPVLLLLMWSGNQAKRLGFTPPHTVVYDTKYVLERTAHGQIEDQPVDLLLVRAQSMLVESQHVWLGALYTYERAGIEEARDLFQEVLSRQEASPQFRAMANFFLGKISLIYGDRIHAADHFERSLDRDGYWKSDAQRLLRLLRGV